MEIGHINCRYCARLISEVDPFCTGCGAPNSPEPLPWYSSMGLRIKSSLKSKADSVWADRLASLMPLHFVLALLQLTYIIFFPPSIGVLTIIAGIAAFVSLAFILVFYPDWYKSSTETRKENGIYYLLILVAYIIITRNFFVLIP